MNKKEIIVSNKLTIRANIVSTHAITLITLVITIVLLIILAGITINISLGNKGIFTQAKQAKKDMERATTIEQIQIEIYDKQLEEEGTSINKQDLENILSKYGEVKKDAEGNITGIKPEGKEEIAIQDIIGNNKITEKDKIKPGESGYEGGAYNDPYIPKGFTHIGEDGWNAGYTIKGTGEGIAPDEFVWVPCVLTIEQQQQVQNNGDTVEILKRTLPSTTDTTDEKYNYNSMNVSITGDIEGANYISKSVEKYGGFYIAKYEAGIDSEGNIDNNSLSTKKPTDGTYKPLSQSGKGVWDYISRANAITVSNKMIDYNKTGVHSTLISGTAWDTTLQWMVNSSDNKAVNAGYDINSEGKGWYNDVSENKLTTTGKYQLNNIYDMGGNVGEWTTENCVYNNANQLVFRGRQLFI